MLLPLSELDAKETPPMIYSESKSLEIECSATYLADCITCTDE